MLGDSNDEELKALKNILMCRRGCVSFCELRTVRGICHDSFVNANLEIKKHMKQLRIWKKQYRVALDKENKEYVLEMQLAQIESDEYRVIDDIILNDDILMSYIENYNPVTEYENEFMEMELYFHEQNID